MNPMSEPWSPQNIQVIDEGTILDCIKQEIGMKSYNRCLNVVDAMKNNNLPSWTIGYDEDGVTIYWYSFGWVLHILHEYENELPDNDDEYFMIQSIYPQPPELSNYNTINSLIIALKTKLSKR